MSGAGMPRYDANTTTTGILICGKMSVGVRWYATSPRIRTSSMPTYTTYGFLSAAFTNHMDRLRSWGMGTCNNYGLGRSIRAVFESTEWRRKERPPDVQ